MATNYLTKVRFGFFRRPPEVPPRARRAPEQNPGVCPRHIKYCIPALIEAGETTLGHVCRTDQSLHHVHLPTATGMECRARPSAGSTTRRPEEYQALTTARDVLRRAATEAADSWYGAAEGGRAP